MPDRDRDEMEADLAAFRRTGRALAALVADARAQRRRMERYLARLGADVMLQVIAKAAQRRRQRPRDIALADVLRMRYELWKLHDREPDEGEVAAELGKHRTTILRVIQDAGFPTYGALPPVWTEDGVE